MENDKDQTDKKNDEMVTSKQERTQESPASTGRPNINVITQRNEEEVKQDRKSFYKTAGIATLLVVVIVIVIYFLS